MEDLSGSDDHFLRSVAIAEPELQRPFQYVRKLFIFM
jgi:hypothetical protein